MGYYFYGRRPKDFFVNINFELIPNRVQEKFNILKDKYGTNLKITDLPSLLKTLIPEIDFEDKERQTDFTPQYISYLIDEQKDFANGRSLDMMMFFRDICKVFHLTNSEKNRLLYSNVEEDLWAIMLGVTNPLREKFNLGKE